MGYLYFLMVDGLAIPLVRHRDQEWVRAIDLGRVIGLSPRDTCRAVAQARGYTGSQEVIAKRNGVNYLTGRGISDFLFSVGVVIPEGKRLEKAYDLFDKFYNAPPPTKFVGRSLPSPPPSSNPTWGLIEAPHSPVRHITEVSNKWL